jgi:hypothetical protein
MIKMKSKDMKLSDLYAYPVWTWKSDLMSSEDTLVPVQMTQEGLADADTLLVHAKFLTASGISHEGLVVYDPDLDDVFAIELFLDDSRITLNRNVQDLSHLELKRYGDLTGENPDGVLPIQYRMMEKSLRIAPAEFVLKE